LTQWKTSTPHSPFSEIREFDDFVDPLRQSEVSDAPFVQ